ARFKLPEGSLYRGFIPNIMKRIYASGIKGAGEDSAPVFEHWSKFDVICNSQVASKVMGVVAYVENVFQDLTPRPSAWPASEIPTEKRTATTRLGIVAFEPRYTMSRFPDYLSPNVTPTKLPKAHKSRARREPSGVFSLFKPPQIQQFKEAFQLIDHDKDGWVTEDDLKEIFSSLGITASKQMLDDLLSARPGGGRMAYSEDRGINFTMFLTMMSERLFEFDTEKELLEAFESFDENDTGMVKVAEMRKWLGEVGERMDKDEIERLLEGSFSDRQGQFHYREWVKVLRVNVDDEGAEHT
ncbi:putative myosin regulatory light chain, partial [Termitomyces sp. T112]